VPHTPHRAKGKAALLLCAFAASSLTAACGAVAGAEPLRIGAIFPLSGSAEELATDEYLGAQLAAEMQNDQGGAGGRRIVLDVRDVETTQRVQPAVDSLRSDGVSVVIGAYSSSLSIPASSAVARAGMVYWETGAVADQVTGQASPLVFRVGADGADLGGSSGRFVLQEIAPRLHRPAAQLRAVLVTADDAYGHSVAAGARSALMAGGLRAIDETIYNPYTPDWAAVTSAVAATHADALLLSSHIPDGIAFRKAFLAARIHVDAFIGTTMAQCNPEFATSLGAGAVGVFGSDRPEYTFNPEVLSREARAVFDRFAARWQQRTGHLPSEEAVSGFTAAWVLFHDVLPPAAAHDPSSIAAAAQRLDLPDGSLPNGAGLRFAGAAGQLGQNQRAAAVMWQWQATGQYVVVWPPPYATGVIKMVPLPA
jgi:branched-chain amino acid transport system substrate-binding protein